MTQPLRQTAGDFPNVSAPLTCAACARSSLWHEAFTQVRDGTLSKLCCPRCAGDIARKHRRAGLVAFVCAALLAPVMLMQTRGHGLDLVVTVYLMFAIALHPLVYLHEIGHALAARLVKAPAYAIVIGFEPWLVDRVFWGIRWRIGRFPGGGVTFHAPCEGSRARWRTILITAVGPFANLVIALVAFGSFVVLKSRPDQSPVALVALVVGIASTYQLVTNLWPRPVTTPAGQMHSDGGRILELMRGAPIEPRTMRAATTYFRAMFLYEDGEYASCARRIARAQELWGDPKIVTALTVIRAAALSESDQAPAAVDLLRPLLVVNVENPGVRAGILDNLGWAYFLLDQPELLDEGIELVREACEIAPWEDSYRISLACLLAASATPANGRTAEARDAMERVAEQRRLARQNAAYAVLARGLIAASESDGVRARELEKRARELKATAAPMRVLERRIASI